MLGSKKALVEIVLQPLFVTFLVLGLLFMSILGKTIALGSDITYDKETLSVDLGVAAGAMQNVHNHANAYLVFKNPKNLSISLSPETITVFKGDKKEKDSKPGLYYFVEDSYRGISVSYKDLVPKKKDMTMLYLVKQGNKLEINSPDVNPDFKPNLNIMSCPKVSSEDLGVVSIDPGHGYDKVSSKGSKGFVNTQLNLAESELALVFASMLRRLGESTKGYEDVDMSMQERIRNLKNSVISIHAGSYDNPLINPAIVYFNAKSLKSEQSKKLGCLILNELSSIGEFTGIALVPVNFELETKVDPESPYAVLTPDKIAILLELGNIQSALLNTISDSAKQRTVSDAIIQGVKRYQGIQ